MCEAVILKVRRSGTSTVAPRSSRSRRCVRQSRTYGTLCSVTVSADSIAAAMQGSAEFFAPLTWTRPLSARPPVILNLSINFRGVKVGGILARPRRRGYLLQAQRDGARDALKVSVYV